jgi:hypothetical protein
VNALVVIEEADRVLVAYADDPCDWLCEFSKAGGFPARRWADGMVAAFCGSSRGSAGRPGGRWRRLTRTQDPAMLVASPDSEDNVRR